MVNADVAQAFAEGRVPTNISYITPAYLAQSRDPPALIAITVLTVLVTVSILLRCISRILLVKNFGLDDGLALFAYACFVAFVVLCIVLIKQGSGRHIEYIQYVLSQDETSSTEINDYAAHLIYTSALFVSRLSGLAFFHRLCWQHEPLLRAITAAIVILVCAFLPQFLLILLHCTPVTGLWPYAWQPDAGAYKCITWGAVYVTNSGLSLACDLLIFSIPIVMISLLKLSQERKAMLVFVLMPGVVVIGISVARLYLCVVGQWASDGSWYYDPQLVIEVAEVGGTIIAFAIPSLKPLFGTCYGRMKSTELSTFLRTKNPDPERHADRCTMGKARHRRRSAWYRDGVFFPGNIKTLVSADKSINDDNVLLRGSTRGSTRGSDKEYMSPGNTRIVVQTDVDQRSIPLQSLNLSERRRKEGG